MVLLKICVDPGASLSKIFYSINNDLAKLLLMDSAMRKMPVESLVHQVSINNNPVQNAWVRINESDIPLAVGFLAQNNYGRARLDLPKYSLAVYKILAAIGAIAVSNKLKKIRLVLTVLLPYGEFGNREDLKQKLVFALKDFYFQQRKMSVKLEYFECAPEGYGLLALGECSLGKSGLKGKDITVLMYGERNTSCLTFRDGVLFKKYSSTVDIGFHRVKKTLCELRPGLKPEIIALALSRLANSTKKGSSSYTLALDPNMDEICWLANSAGYSTVSDRQKIVDAIINAKRDVWFLLSEWLDIVFPSSISYLIVSGGASHFWRDNINAKFQWVTSPKINWLNEWIPYLITNFELSKRGMADEETLLAYRVLDAYGYWGDLTASLERGIAPNSSR